MRTAARPTTLRRTCACGGRAGPTGECEQCRRKRLGLQRVATAPAPTGTRAPAIVHDVLRSPGQPLPPATREAMEARLGGDFGSIRVHADARAAESARAVHARAYAVGRDVVFAAGEFRPGTASGVRLLAHELVHTLQQQGACGGGAIEIGPPDDAFEQEAERAAASATAARHVAQAPARLQRQHPVPGSPAPAGPYTGYQQFPPPPKAPVPPPPPCRCPVLPLPKPGDAVCAQPICGSSWDFSHRVAATEPATPPVGRIAWALTGFANAADRSLLAGVYAVAVSPKISPLAGAEAGGCELLSLPEAKDEWCIHVPEELERQAEIFNAGSAQMIGTMSRDRWRANAIRILTHEATHISFAKQPPPGVTFANEIARWELDELNARLSEVPILYRQLRTESASPAEAETRFRHSVGSLVDGCGEGIRGIVRKLHCFDPKALPNIKAVFAAASGTWGAEENRIFLEEVRDPARNLGWPT